MITWLAFPKCLSLFKRRTRSFHGLESFTAAREDKTSAPLFIRFFKKCVRVFPERGTKEEGELRRQRERPPSACSEKFRKKSEVMEKGAQER